jgi:hypothetical protein
MREKKDSNKLELSYIHTDIHSEFVALFRFLWCVLSSHKELVRQDSKQSNTLELILSIHRNLVLVCGPR